MASARQVYVRVQAAAQNGGSVLSPRQWRFVGVLAQLSLHIIYSSTPGAFASSPMGMIPVAVEVWQGSGDSRQVRRQSLDLENGRNQLRAMD